VNALIPTLIKNLCRHVGEEVEIRGWLYNKRSSGKIAFLILRDGSGLVQAVLLKANEAAFAVAESLTQESSLCLRGTVRAENRAAGGYEIEVTSLEPVSIAKEYPISLKEHGVEFLADRRHLWIRMPKQAAILRIRSEIEFALREFFYQRDFVLADAPIITPAACEGTTNLFEIDYHGDKGYLSQSGQLYNEATAAALGRIYCFGPTFRAEKSKTRRHLLEFWMIEAEAAFFDMNDNMQLQEDMIVFVIERVLERCRIELKLLERDEKTFSSH
jgi:asparaginyl-tRNA synthetase